MQVPPHRSLVVTLEELRQAGLQGWIVGGAVRDLLQGSPVLDYDVAVTGDALVLARRVANRLKAAYVPLDEERRIARVVPRDGPQLDFASLAGLTIEDDLRRRDLTINALALELGSEVILDPTGGLEDLRLGLVRVPSEAVLEDDPLRVLRVFRFAGKLGFSIEPATLEAVLRRADSLHSVSPERIRDELFKILALPHSTPVLSKMNGVLAVVLAPLGGVGLGAAEFEAQEFEAAAEAWLDEIYGESRTRRSLIKLMLVSACPTAAGAEALRLSSREVRAVERWCRISVSKGDWFEVLEAAQEDSLGVAILGRADVSKVSALYARWVTAGKTPLLRGNDIMRLLGLPPGPAIGSLAAALRRAQASGQILTVEDAETFVRRAR